MARIVEDIVASADWIAGAMRYSRYKADFSPQSLWEVDRFFDEHSLSGKPKPGGLLGEECGKRLFALGGYVGEVLRREKGGDWRASDADPDDEVALSLHLRDGTTCWPVQRVMKRLQNGPEESIVAYGVGFGLTVGPRPAPRPWWKFW